MSPLLQQLQQLIHSQQDEARQAKARIAELEAQLEQERQERDLAVGQLQAALQRAQQEREAAAAARQQVCWRATSCLYRYCKRVCGSRG